MLSMKEGDYVNSTTEPIANASGRLGRPYRDENILREDYLHL